MWKIKAMIILRNLLFVLFLFTLIMLIVFAFYGFCWFCVPCLMCIGMWYAYRTAGTLDPNDENIYAVGAGIAHGLDYGDNFMSVYMAAAANEMASFLIGL